MIPAFSSETQAKNKIWVGTFQLVWNDFMDEVIKGPVKFENYESQDADALNKQEFKTSMLSESSYYTAWGRPDLALKEKIESELMEKFGEKIKGFNASDVPLTGVETRTSSPVRILRTENYNILNDKDVYPGGEGAGYAGGIMSAAVDGVNIALAILNEKGL